MKFAVLIYFVIAIFAGGQALWAGDYIDGAAIVVGSFIAFAAGSGFRGSLYLKKPVLPAALIGGTIFASSFAIMHYLDLTVDLLDGRTWAVIGAAVGFFATDKADAAPRDRISSPVLKVKSENFLDDCFAAVAAYGKVVEEFSGEVLPLDQLPLPKQQMKKALQVVWVAVDDASSKDSIEAAYSFLANFREEVTKPTSLGSEELAEMSETDSPRPEILAQISRRLSLLQTVNEDALQLAYEFEQFKVSQAG